MFLHVTFINWLKYTIEKHIIYQVLNLPTDKSFPFSFLLILYFAPLFLPLLSISLLQYVSLLRPDK